MIRVLFVCMGNICRSPMAEGIFRALAAETGLLDKTHGIGTDSAGTTGYHQGQPPDPRAIRQLRQAGIDIGHQRARQVTAGDFVLFDYIVAMDRDNLHYLERLAPENSHAGLSLMLSHAPIPGPDEVPDPYYGADDGFMRCHNLIGTAAKGLLQQIIATHFSASAQSPR